MALPITPLALSQIQTEFGGTNPISLSEYYRGGANVPTSTVDGGYGRPATSGPISMGTFRNTAKIFIYNLTIAADTFNYDLTTAAMAAGWDGTTPIQAVVTINSGVVVSANTTAVSGFTVGSMPATSIISVVNNGYIIGMGGQGGDGSYADLTCCDGYGHPYYIIPRTHYATSGLNGGTALQVGYAISMTNNGIIGGGGGGGGGSDSPYQPSSPGGGGGQTGRQNSLGGGGNYGSYQGTFSGPGSAILPSGHGNAGAGGGWGAAGGSGSGWPGDYLSAYGGNGGAAVVGTGYITWLATGTRYGALA